MFEMLNESTTPLVEAPIPDPVSHHRAWLKFTGIIVLEVIAVIGNGLLIFTVIRHKHLRTNTNAFIVSLAAADFLFAFPTMPFYIMARSAKDSLFGQPLSTICLIAMSMTAFQMIVTITTLLALTFERYLCILYPLKHRTWAQRKHVTGLIGFHWIYAVFIGALPLMGWNTLHIHNPWEKRPENATVELCTALKVVSGPYIGLLYVFHIFPVCLLLPFFYVRMFFAIRKFVARKSSHSSLDTELDGHLLNETESTDRTQEQRNAAVRRSSRRSLRLLVVVVVYAIFSWMPNFIWYTVATHGYTRLYTTSDMIREIPIPAVFYHIASTLGFANSAVNPYIYGLANVPIRKAFMQTFCPGSLACCPGFLQGKGNGQSGAASSDLCDNTLSQTRLPNISNGSEPVSSASGRTL